MSWQVKDEATELDRLRNDLNKIRDQLFISNFATGLPSGFLVGGVSGQGSPLGSGFWSLVGFQTDANVTITDVDTTGVSTGVFDKINITTSNMIVKAGGGSSNIKFIQGTLNDGQFIIIKPQTGTTKTLKTGGNINISGDVVISDKEFVMAIFYEEQTSPDSNGNYVIHKFGTAVAPTSFYQTIQDEGTPLTQRPTFNFTGTAVTAVDDAGNNRTNINITAGIGVEFFGPWTAPHTAGIFSLIDLDFITFFSPLGAIGIQRAGVGPVGLEYEALASGAHDFFVNRGVVGFPIVGITQTGVFVNFPITMANPGNRNIFMGLDGNIVDLQDINQMRDLFFNANGTPFTNSRQLGGEFLGVFVNVPTGKQFNVDFNGVAEWQFTNQALVGGSVLSSILLQSFFLLAPQPFAPLFDGELRNVSGDLKAASGGLIFDFTKANPTAMGQDIVFPGASGFTIDFDGSNISLSATAGFQTLPANPLLFLIVKLGGATVKIPVYSP